MRPPRRSSIDLPVGVGETEVAADELVVVLEDGQGGAGVGHEGPPGGSAQCFPRCRLPSSVASP